MTKRSVAILGVCLSSIFFVAGFGTKQSFAYDGETGGAIVQSIDEANDDNSTRKFTVTVKIKKTGSYVVAAGFVKNNKMHKGSFSGTKFYGTSTVTGDAGDQITVTIRRVSSPPLNNTYGAGVYDGEGDIKTGG